ARGMPAGALMLCFADASRATVAGQLPYRPGDRQPGWALLAQMGQSIRRQTTTPTPPTDPPARPEDTDASHPDRTQPSPT
ncbi:MAG TPA: hypothetical protein VFM55_23225, partial [Micromonosporaceae bacterium]|nr:hypothetical protein [Micromonosporaceae bacterium]